MLLRLLLAALALPAVLTAQLSHNQTSHKLLVVSIGGLDARFLNDPSLRVKAPNIRKLMKEGASATIVGVAPSDTWPSHASMVTGVSPWQNGITVDDLPSKPGDRFFSVEALRTPALWDLATKAGLKVGTVFWPSTLGAHVAFDFPEYWEARQGNAVPVDAIAARSTPPGIADLVSKAYPSFDKQLWDDTSSADAAMYLLSVEHPDVLFVHMADIDAEQRDTTALSIYARDVLENDDDLVGQILKMAPSDAVVALVSDHGFENSNRIVRPRVLLRQAGVKGDVEVADGLIGTSDPKVAEALRRLMAEGRKSGIAREVRMAEVRARVPSLGRWVAAFDPFPDYVARDEERGSGVGIGPHAGMDKVWPTQPNYRAILIVNGPGVKPVKLGDIDMLQIAPTLADVIGVKIPAARGQSVWRAITR